MFHERPAHRHHSVNVNVNLRLFVTATATVVDSELWILDSGLWTRSWNSVRDEVQA